MTNTPPNWIPQQGTGGANTRPTGSQEGLAAAPCGRCGGDGQEETWGHAARPCDECSGSGHAKNSKYLDLADGKRYHFIGVRAPIVGETFVAVDGYPMLETGQNSNTPRTVIELATPPTPMEDGSDARTLAEWLDRDSDHQTFLPLSVREAMRRILAANQSSPTPIEQGGEQDSGPTFTVTQPMIEQMLSGEAVSIMDQGSATIYLRASVGQDSGERLAVKLLRELVALDAACAGSHLAVAPLEAKIDEARDFLAALTATHPPEVGGQSES